MCLWSPQVQRSEGGQWPSLQKTRKNSGAVRHRGPQTDQRTPRLAAQHQLAFALGSPHSDPGVLKPRVQSPRFRSNQCNLVRGIPERANRDQVPSLMGAFCQSVSASTRGLPTIESRSNCAIREIGSRDLGTAIEVLLKDGDKPGSSLCRPAVELGITVAVNICLNGAMYPTIALESVVTASGQRPGIKAAEEHDGQLVLETKHRYEGTRLLRN
ncbi:uncharacterized protein BCR38DRAFT_478542 [Pseudomassariella vexata]|uniref:Uncharacterized protein n=1 Tax=Pseudomassariella vexata TaxID=1141098 RepID=A0A1Y2DCA3_9PEZI|nr:uncharacterized protein BCR38DRAFT_478542 [Pseudomassariella vexata]ORY56902.1 hypothetical protein BCR38DRAFT_478542 [Pseudomassariella vexata]